MSLRFTLLDPHARLPAFARPDDAGLDLFAIETAVLEPAGGRASVRTGVSVELDKNMVGLLCPRSGLAADHGVTVLNAPGVIDSGYRGEIKVILINHDPSHGYVVQPGDRVAQLLIVQLGSIDRTGFEIGNPSERGASGFGESGR